MSTVAPFINDYKKKFVKKRLLENFLGGLLLIIDSDDNVPIFIYALQIIVFVIPFCFGGISILIADLNGQDSNERWKTSLIASSIFFLYIIILKLMSVILNYKTNAKNKESVDFKKSFEDDSKYEFDGDFFSMTTLNFVIPPSDIVITKFDNLVNRSKIDGIQLLACISRIIIDALLALFMMFCSINFLSIVYLQTFYSIDGAICIFIFNWVVVSLAFYSLCIRDPPEPAIYEPYGSKTNRYTRCFYVLSFQLIEIFYNYLPSNGIPLQLIFWLKILIILLPIAFFFGLLPPIDALFFFLLEEVHMFVYGGSTAASNLRLCIQLFASIFFSLAHFIPSDLAIIIIFSVFGYIIASIDLIYITEFLLFLRNSKSVSKDKRSDNYNFFFKWKDILYHFVMIALTIASVLSMYLVSLNNNLTEKDCFMIQRALLFAGLFLLIVIKMLADIQRVYVIFGFIRNPFYSRNCLTDSLKKGQSESLNQNRKIFKIFRFMRIILLKIVIPILLCLVVTLDCYMNGVYNDNVLGYFRTICVLRAYRWIWQSTYNCLFEMSFLTNLITYVIIYESTSDVNLKQNIIKYFLVSSLASSFVRDRLSQFFNKIYAFFLITISSYSIKKQRRTSSLVFMTLNALFFIPFGIIHIGITALISAPLLALFTFPIFLTGFSRNKKFWPEKGNFFSKSLSIENFESDKSVKRKHYPVSDSCFYVQMMPVMVKSIREHILSGSLGDIQPGSFLLSRFQDRIIWFQVMESSSSYCIINIKGLELQETSCHTQEAQFIDDFFDSTFENPNKSLTNPNFKSCMSCLDVLLFEAYSDAKNTLVGILDNPDTLKLISQFFPKILHYFLMEYQLKNNKNQIKRKSFQINGIDTESPFKEFEKSTTIRKSSNKTEKSSEKLQDTLSFLTERSYVQNNSESEIQSNKWSDSDFNSDDEFTEKNEQLRMTTFSSNKPPKLSSSNNQNPFEFDLDKILGAIDMKDELAVDDKHLEKNKKEKSAKKSITLKKCEENNIPNPISSEPIKIIKPPVLTPIERVSSFGLPNDWMNFFNEDVKGSRSENEQLKTCLMSKEWLDKIIETIKNTNEIDTLKIEPNTLKNLYAFTMKCCATLGLSKADSVMTSTEIDRFFQGKLPWTPINERITQELPDLHAIFIKSFQHTIKMIIDNETIYPVTETDDFFETLESYIKEWYIGMESDFEYAMNILARKEFIFSLYLDTKKKALCSRTLSLQKIKSPIASVNKEIVKSIWSSTNLELLFMTNDDEERYSIQANHLLLRNLTIQSSDPPLGYAIYNSGNIIIPINCPF